MSSLADLPDLVGFFSYSRSDDEHAQGALSKLRARIHSELRLQLGRNLRLWQDTAAIPDGALWADEIKRAIAESVFFIPIVTPSAISSVHCKFEFDSFLKREEVLGRRNLVFPLLFIRVPALEDERRRQENELLTIICARQYVDWQRLRLRDSDSTEVAARIEQFCRNIVDALQQPLLSPEEDAKAQEAELRRKAEEEQQRIEQRRARQEAEAKRQPEEHQEQEKRREEADARAREAEAHERAEAVARSKRQGERQFEGNGDKRRSPRDRDASQSEEASSSLLWSLGGLLIACSIAQSCVLLFQALVGGMLFDVLGLDNCAWVHSVRKLCSDYGDLTWRTLLLAGLIILALAGGIGTIRQKPSRVLLIILAIGSIVSVYFFGYTLWYWNFVARSLNLVSANNLPLFTEYFFSANMVMALLFLNVLAFSSALFSIFIKGRRRRRLPG